MATTATEKTLVDTRSVAFNRLIGRSLRSVRLHVAVGFNGEGRWHTHLPLSTLLYG